MYDSADPRARLREAPRKPREAHPPRKPQFFELRDSDPDEAAPNGSRTWWVRSQHLVVGLTEAATGTRLERSDQPDEYIALFPSDRTRATITTSAGTTFVTGETIAVIPPGESAIGFSAGGEVYRIFTAASADLTARCRNAGVYAEPDLNVAEFTPWPVNADPQVRCYAPTDAVDDPARFGRIYRCSTLMVNVLPVEHGPRPTNRLSPHDHDDFEQVSIQLTGSYVHHLRTPWTPDLSAWREDEHLCGTGPAILVIPPQIIHTTQSVGSGSHRLVDVFCPPRRDFAETPGWVLNADDYPLPQEWSP